MLDISNPLVYPDDFPSQVAATTQDAVSELDEKIRRSLYCVMRSNRHANHARIIAEKYNILTGERMPRDGIPDDFYEQISAFIPVSSSVHTDSLSMATSQASSLAAAQADILNLQTRVGILEST
jgi:hypothetical protein